MHKSGSDKGEGGRIFFNAFLGVKFYLQTNHTDLRRLLDIKVLTQQAKGTGALVAYFFGGKP